MDNVTPTQTQQPPEYALTSAGLATLSDELATLRGKRDRLTDGGTLRDELLLLDARIAALEEILDHAWIVDPDALDHGVVAIGTTVGLRDLDSEQTELYRVVGKHEPLRPGELSAASAVGNAVMGRRVGDAVTVDLPNGRSRRLAITAAEPVGGAG
jgi:transcription elongation factor GreA